MDALLRVIPKNLIAFLAITGGILFIVLSQPPHTVCDSQLEVIKKAQEKFLYKDPKSKKVNTTRYQTLYDHCKITNNPGGCYELFQEMKVLLYDLGTLSSECSGPLGAVPEHKRALWDVTELLIRLAWGDKPPESYHAKFGWLDTADVSLYCRLKERIIAFYGDAAWTRFREPYLNPKNQNNVKELPGSKDMTRNQIWDMSLLSENCARYP